MSGETKEEAAMCAHDWQPIPGWYARYRCSIVPYRCEARPGGERCAEPAVRATRGKRFRCAGHCACARTAEARKALAANPIVTPAHEVVTASREVSTASRVDATAGHVDATASHVDATASHVDATASHVDATAGHVHVTASREVSAAPAEGVRAAGATEGRS